ncbi:MAG: ribonuclease J [Firmicutes bacterium]|nr:ribonuclease J [Bacillota bacterium]
MGNEFKITFLGGLGEIGRNCAVVEQNDSLLIIDCGIMFPNLDMPGVDLVLPDFSYILERRDKLAGIVLTHGHEDHVGALSYLLKDVDTKIFGSAFTLEIARSRIEEAGISLHNKLVTVRDGERRAIGPFDVEFIPVTHSVPHGFAVAIHGSFGVILHSGDFKIDLAPVDGRRTDLGRIGQIAKEEGISLLLSDSTNADEPGFTASESSIAKTLNIIFTSHKDSRIIVACFASHIHRIQQLINAAVLSERKVALIGRSMIKGVNIARDLGLLHVPPGVLIELDHIDRYEPGNVCVISTGSQGEPMSALTLLASGSNKNITLSDNDLVVLSSHVIPGNEWSVTEVVNNLAKRTVEVIDSETADVHASGHARRGELATLLNIATPKCFIPVHGEHRHLLSHANLAIDMGVSPENICICEDGDQVVLDEDSIEIVNRIPAPYSYVDGIVGDLQEVLRDRQFLAKEGVVVVAVSLDKRGIVTGPEIVSKGWLHLDGEEEFVEKAGQAIRQAVTYAVAGEAIDAEEIKRIIKRNMSKLVYEHTKRRPLIIPLVLVK